MIQLSDVRPAPAEHQRKVQQDLPASYLLNVRKHESLVLAGVAIKDVGLNHLVSNEISGPTAARAPQQQQSHGPSL